MFDGKQMRMALDIGGEERGESSGGAAVLRLVADTTAVTHTHTPLTPSPLAAKHFTAPHSRPNCSQP